MLKVDRQTAHKTKTWLVIIKVCIVYQNIWDDYRDFIIYLFFINSPKLNRINLFISSMSWFCCRHGIFQLRSGWADGPEYITQCPILPGNHYTYRFTITGQEGTLWWHAHVQWLRATVHGALIIRPRKGHSYPFPKPYKGVRIILGTFQTLLIRTQENFTRLQSLCNHDNDTYWLTSLLSTYDVTRVFKNQKWEYQPAPTCVYRFRYRCMYLWSFDVRDAKK